MAKRKIGVIGGGASGMMAAITAARDGAKVTLLESGERVGKKILATGNGKCNLGNLNLSAKDYYGASKEWIAQCLSRFDEEETIRFFQGIGLMLKEKNGYLYPLSEQASSVLDVLRAELSSVGVEVITQAKVRKVEPCDDGHFLVCTDEAEYHFDKVVVACGSKAAPKTGSDGSGYKIAKKLGHDVVGVVPALVQLKCEENFFKEIAGVRVDAKLTIDGGYNAGEVISERGELQLTDYGISGIPVLQLSRQVNYILRDFGRDGSVPVMIDFLPDMSAEEVEQLYAVRKLLQTDRTVEEFFTGMLNKKLMLLFIKLAGLRRETPVGEANEDKLRTVFDLCKNFRVSVIGSNSYDNAQVCAGGVDTAQVNTNMESLLVPGLYFAGEILDVDGRCGGYNLQWAWCSGYLAGHGAANL